MTNEIGQRVRERIRLVAPTLTQEEIASTVGIAPDAFSRALNGRRGFAAIELARLAELLHSSMYWLTTGERDPNEPLVVARHTFNPERATRSADWAGIDRVLTDICLAYSQVALPTIGSRLPTTARTVREALGPGFVAQFADRIESVFGVDVIRLAGVQTAVAMIVAGRSVIVMGETGNWFYQNWSLAHELGHLALGHIGEENAARRPEGDIDTQEAAANAFAAALLLPADEIRQCDWQRMSPGELSQLIWNWGVSTDAVARRLHSLNMEVAAHIATLLRERTQSLLRHHWQASGEGADPITRRMQLAAYRRFPLELQAAHVEAIATGAAPKATLAWMLGIDESELEVEQPPASATADLDELAIELGLIERP